MFDGRRYSGDAYVPGTYMTAVVDADGIRHYDVSYVLEELESGESKKVLTLDEALQAVDDKYNSVIMEGEYFIDDIQMAYTPVQTEETGIVRLIPVWYFQTTHQILVPNRSGTGEVMLPQKRLYPHQCAGRHRAAAQQRRYMRCVCVCFGMF